QVLHGDKSLSVLLVNFVDGTDVRMVQGGGRLRLPLEATQCLRVLSHFVRQKLQSDETVKLDVFRLIDDTHAAAAQLLRNLIMRDRSADHLSRHLRWASRASQ